MDSFFHEDIHFRFVEQNDSNKDGVLAIPVFRAVPCGPPNFIDNEVQGYIEIPEKMLGAGEFFVLRAKGDSMVDAGIADQDLIIIKKQSFAEEKQIAVVFVEGEVTLKRIHIDKRKNVIELRPDNSNYSPIIAKECIVLGVAVKVIKDLQYGTSDL